MPRHAAVLTVAGTALLAVSAFAFHYRQDTSVRQGGRNQARTETPVTAKFARAGVPTYLMFDVTRQDYRDTTRYVLEITDPSGNVTTTDLQKPYLQKKSIMVPLPPLLPGKYRIAVIAEGPAGQRRSAELPIEIGGT